MENGINVKPGDVWEVKVNDWQRRKYLVIGKTKFHAICLFVQDREPVDKENSLDLGFGYCDASKPCFKPFTDFSDIFRTLTATDMKIVRRKLAKAMLIETAEQEEPSESIKDMINRHKAITNKLQADLDEANEVIAKERRANEAMRKDSKKASKDVANALAQVAELKGRNDILTAHYNALIDRLVPRTVPFQTAPGKYR